MPIYEFRCTDCGRKTTVLTLRVSEQVEPKCERCGSAKLTRLMSRFATVKSAEARLDSLADSSSYGDLDEDNPASVAKFMKKMGQEFGDDLGGDFESAMDEAMAEGEGGGETNAESTGASEASDQL